MMLMILFLSAAQLLMTTPVKTTDFNLYDEDIYEVSTTESAVTPFVPKIETSGFLVEGRNVTITCSVVTPTTSSPPKLSWNLHQDSPNQTQENGNQTFTTKIQENVTLSDKHDGFIITCSARYPVSEGRETITAETLHVKYSPRDVMVVVSPTDPVSIGSLVNLTCSARGNPPVDHFTWILVSDGKLDLILDSTQVYSFNVTSSDRGRWYYCVCSRGPHVKVSPGRQLIFEGHHQSGLVGVEAVVKILGIIMLVGTVVIFECWFRSRCSTKPVKDAVEADYINRVIESRAL